MFSVPKCRKMKRYHKHGVGSKGGYKISREVDWLFFREARDAAGSKGGEMGNPGLCWGPCRRCIQISGALSVTCFFFPAYLGT